MPLICPATARYSSDLLEVFTDLFVTILKTPQAADALGCCVSYLKRQRDTHGGFLELGKHYHRKPSSNASITWDVDLIRAEMNKRSRAPRVRAGS